MGFRFIKQFIDFCYADLENASISEKRRLFDETIGILYDYNFPASPTLLPPFEIIWPGLLKDQVGAHDFLEWLFEHKGLDYGLSFSLPHRFTAGGGNPDELFFLRKLRPSKFNRKPEQIGWATDDVSINIVSLRDASKEIIETAYPWIVIKFLEALDGYAVKMLLRCPKCDQIFFNPTKRKQVYCSSKCRALAGVHRARRKERANRKAKTKK